jgi:hypothetical protein
VITTSQHMGLQRLYTLALAAQQPLNCSLFNRSSSSIGCGDCGDCGELDLPVETETCCILLQPEVR